MIQTESQNRMIRQFLEDGNSITGLEALNKFGCMSLPRRICDIKEKGVAIESQWIKLENGKRIKEYWIAQ